MFFSLTSFFTARYFSNNLDLLLEESTSNSAYTSSIKLLVFFLGFLFAFSISHDMINRELEMQTIRLLVTKVTRLEIIGGKFLGVFGFWFVCLTLSFILVSINAKEWFWLDYFIVINFILYVVSLILLISTLVKKTSLSMFLGIMIGVILPIIGFASTIKDHFLLVPIKYISPYYYIIQSGYYLITPLMISTVFILISYVLLKKRDL